jgi:DNA modification methylase
MTIEIMEGDCLDILPTFPDNTFDLVLTSPPYPGAPMNSLEGESIEDQIIRLDKLSRDAMMLCAPKLKLGGALCWNIMDIPLGDIGVVPNAMKATKNGIEAGLIFRGPIIWNKGCPYHLHPNYNLRPLVPNITYEYILVFFKGTRVARDLKKIKNDISGVGVWTVGPTTTKQSSHICAFPLALATRLVDFFSIKSDLILDPFVGSGTTLMACQNLGRNAIGIELVHDYAELARVNVEKNRLNNPEKGLELW